VAGVEEVRRLVFGREEPEGADVLGAVREVEADDVGLDSTVGVGIRPGGGAVAVRLGGVVAVAVLEGVESAGFRLVIVADTEEFTCPLGGAALGKGLVLADEFEEIATVTSGVVVPQALLGAGEFDIQRVAGVAEDVADDPLRADLAAGWEELSAEFCDADGEGVREFGEGHACRCEVLALSVVVEIVFAGVEECIPELLGRWVSGAAGHAEALVIAVGGLRGKVGWRWMAQCLGCGCCVAHRLSVSETGEWSQSDSTSETDRAIIAWPP
jgi:hypothetical protein